MTDVQNNKSINKQCHTKLENNHKTSIHTVTCIINMYTYQNLHNNIENHIKADLTVIGKLVYYHFPYLSQSQYICSPERRI